MVETSEDQVRTPFGEARRCAARSSRTGQRCRKAAVKGATVCATHGVGCRRRAAAGTRKDPRLASLKTGAAAKPATIELLREADPSFAARLGYYREHKERLRDCDELLSRSWAIADVLQERLEGSSEGAPPLLLALRHLTDTFSVVSRLESRFDTHRHVPIADLQQFMALVVELVQAELPRERAVVVMDRLEAALAVK